MSTPGPWKAEYNNSDHSGGGCWYEITNEHGGDLFWFPYNGDGSDGVRALANATLAASAPELLEALENIAAMTGYQDCDMCLEVNNTARAAIAKARGEA